jgi:hypothetical protein
MLSPSIFTAGETMAWVFSSSDYGSAEYDLVVNFSSAAGAFQATSTDRGDGGWDVALPASATADASPGIYGYSVVVTKGEGDALERHILERGSVELLPLLDGAAAVDARSSDEIILDAIIATIQGRATTDQESVNIDGTSISRMSLADLIVARNHFEARVNRKRRRSRLSQVRF